jgi:acetyltransferase-like isoleucine patch superfamily enzyme
MKIDDRGKNNIVVSKLLAPDHARLTIKGNNNRVTVAHVGRVLKLDLIVEGDGGSIEIGALTRVEKLLIIVKNGGSVKIGALSTFEECYILADTKLVTIGEDCMVSFATSLRTTDAHGIYDLTTGERTNPTGPITLEDHVWVGQGVIIAKNVLIGKNSVVGARSYAQNLTAAPHTLVAGTPARVIRQNIVWDRRNSENIYADGADVDPNLWRWVDRRGSDQT